MTARVSAPRKSIVAWVLAAACVLGWERAAHPQDLKPGTVIPRVECRTEKGFSFALYLPSTYAPGRPWPVIFCFSPSGRGVDPVLLLQASAERYGYIVVGSNDSKNGPWGPVAKAQTALWKEVNERFPVDPARSYAVGFSGGARAAMSMALKHRGEFAGVISCGAFTAEDRAVPKSCGLSLYMLVGNEDFDYFEFTYYDRWLTKRNDPHWLEVFDGPHQWPAAPLLTQAVEFMQAEAMRRGLVPRDPAFLERLAGQRLAWAQALEARGELTRAYREYRQGAEFLPGTPQSEVMAREGSRLEKDPRVQESLRLEQTFEEYSQRVESAGDPPSILGVLRDLDRARQAGGAAARNADIVFRLAGFHFSELGATLLRMGRYREAAFCLETSVAVAPGNPLYAYNAACATARCGLKAKALGYLRRAVANGFKDRALMAKDPDLDSLRKEPDFARILASVKAP
ncbi:MAG: hypothetical protein WBS54_12550 [Acidobacteriota bacterium]